MKVKQIRTLTIGFFCTLLFFPIYCLAKDIKLTPSIQLQGEYNDNVRFSRNDEQDDFLFNIRPAATVDYNTGLFHLDTTGAVNVERYVDETSLDTEKYEFDLNSYYQFRPRWRASGLFSFTQDKTIDEEVLFDEGVVTRRETRRRYRAGGGLAYQITERSKGILDFEYTKKTFSGDGVDSDNYRAEFTYERALRNQVDVVSVSPFYRRLESDEVSDIDEYGLLFGWVHPFSETLRLNASAGASYAVQDFKDERSTDRNLMPLADVNLEKQGELFSAMLGYSRDIRTPSDGEPRETDRIYGRADLRIIERLFADFFGYITFGRSVENSNDQKTRLFSLRPSLRYQLTENHNVRLGYAYTNELDMDRDTDRTRDRNSAWLGLEFNFPKQWNY